MPQCVDSEVGKMQVYKSQGNRIKVANPVQLHKQDVKVLKDSLSNDLVSCEEAHVKMNRANTPIVGRFQVFRICRSQDIIFIMDDPRCEDLDLKPVALGGIAGKFNGRIRKVGVVEGTIRSDVPIYRIVDEALALKRVTGGMVRFKK